MRKTPVKKERTLNYGTAILSLSMISLTLIASGLIMFFEFYVNEGYPVSMLLKILPAVLFFLYIAIFYSKSKAMVLVPIVFGLFSLEAFFSGFYLILLPFILLFICSLRGFRPKILSIIALSVCFSWEIIAVVSYLDVCSIVIYHVGTIMLYIALFLFMLKNRIPSILSVSPEKEKAKLAKMAPEKALKLLKEILELGEISEEDYQAQRAEIIRKL